MRLRDARTWFGAASLLLVLTLFVLDFERTSPGPLSAAHAQDPTLEDPEGCNLCHGSWGRSLARACSDCHAEIDRQLARSTGFHGNLPRGEAASCQICHVEHHGRKAELVSARSFVLAGFEGRGGYDHAGLAFGLAGVHEELECKDCHANADVEVLGVGEQRFLGLDQDCAACHDDPHQGRMAESCDACHGQEHPFAEVASFAHTDAFPLVGSHGDPACLDCHEKNGPHAVELLAGAEGAVRARDCMDCHASSHSAGFLAGVAAFADTAPEASCSLCHDASHGSFEGQAVKMSSELHAAASGFALDAPHDRAACADCHTMEGEHGVDFVAREPVRSTQACGACHSDPHAGQFTGGAFAGKGCVACHDSHAFRPPAFDVERHALARFELEGTHREVECAACHRRPADDPRGPRVFNGTPAACRACHDDVHRGAFDEPELPEPFRGQEGCARCHGTLHFDAGVRESFDHGLWTGFALDGAHRSAACDTCHHPSQEARRAGRTLGFAADAYPGPRERCETCHADVHAGAFDDPGLPGVVEGRVGCARCHDTDSFHAVDGEAFDHGRWTAFELEGAHARAECSACHGSAAEPLDGRSLGFVASRFAGPPSRCSTCHEDPHAGAFDEPGAPAEIRNDCARCHSVESFLDLTSGSFDHARWTGFELTGIHARTACAACHVPALGPAAAQRRRLGPTAGKQCSECHADPHAGQFARDGAGDCAACHAPGGPTFADLVFDHQRDSRYPLDDRHSKLACSACHVPWPAGGGREVVRYKPLGTTCSDCHGQGGKR